MSSSALVTMWRLVLKVLYAQWKRAGPITLVGKMYLIWTVQALTNKWFISCSDCCYECSGCFRCCVSATAGAGDIRVTLTRGTGKSIFWRVPIRFMSFASTIQVHDSWLTQNKKVGTLFQGKSPTFCWMNIWLTCSHQVRLFSSDSLLYSRC